MMITRIKTIPPIAIFMFLFLSLPLINSCGGDSDSDPDPDDPTGIDGILLIENGALALFQEDQVEYSAVLAKIDGAESPSSVTWSTSNTDIATFSGSTLTAAGVGETTITANATVGGKSYTATIPLVVYAKSLFTVSPAVILVDEEWPVTIPLTPFYLGNQNLAPYTYESSNTSVASVSSTGEVSIEGEGSCSITVTATGLSSANTFSVAVYVVPVPEISLPVTSIQVSADYTDILKGETVSLTAKAYNIEGELVNDISFDWHVSDATVGQVNSDGQFSASDLGKVSVYASYQGVSGKIDLTVHPDKILEISPFLTNLAPGTTKQLEPKTYQLERASNGSISFSITDNPADLTWQEIGDFISVFDIIDITQEGLVTMKENASPGMFTIVEVYSPSNDEIGGGAAMIGVLNCDCGADNGVTSITTDKDVYETSITDFDPPTVVVTTDPVGQNVVFCPENPAVLFVEEGGILRGLLPGETNLLICSGSASKTVKVVVN